MEKKNANIFVWSFSSTGQERTDQLVDETVWFGIIIVSRPQQINPSHNLHHADHEKQKGTRTWCTVEPNERLSIPSALNY